MARETLLAIDAGGKQARFLLDVFQDGDHWTSTLTRLNDRGEAEPDRVAPRFYGASAEAARRRMLGVLENQYEEVLREKSPPAG